MVMLYCKEELSLHSVKRLRTLRSKFIEWSLEMKNREKEGESLRIEINGGVEATIHWLDINTRVRLTKLRKSTSQNIQGLGSNKWLWKKIEKDLKRHKETVLRKTLQGGFASRVRAPNRTHLARQTKSKVEFSANAYLAHQTWFWLAILQISIEPSLRSLFGLLKFLFGSSTGVALQLLARLHFTVWPTKSFSSSSKAISRCWHFQARKRQEDKLQMICMHTLYFELQSSVDQSHL